MHKSKAIGPLLNELPGARRGFDDVVHQDRLGDVSNIIALEGADHGILSNTVLPFGFSRMVTETVEPDALKSMGLLDLIGPDKVVPIVTYLASRACQSSHENYSACAGRYARVFVGLGEGWLAGIGTDATADDIAEHFAEISGTEPFTIPANIYEELFGVVGRLGVDLPGGSAAADS